MNDYEGCETANEPSPIMTQLEWIDGGNGPNPAGIEMSRFIEKL